MRARTAHGEVVKLDRGLPLVELEDGKRLRCEHAAALQKHGHVRACIGDRVEVELPDAHEVGVIERIEDRESILSRKDPNDRATGQIMAANFDKVLIVQPIDRFNPTRLQRELVMAHQSNAAVGVLLTKADLLPPDEVARIVEEVHALGGAGVSVMAITIRKEEATPACAQGKRARSTAAKDHASTIDQTTQARMIESSDGASLEDTFPPNSTTILLGSSGAGKSSLINALVGSERQQTCDVRAQDGKGRHTTVSREIITLPNKGRVVDMPGIRGVGLWDADRGLARAFADIEEMAETCRFRDCTHTSEPDCAVRKAVADGSLGQARLDYYLQLKDEEHAMAEQRERARWARRK